MAGMARTPPLITANDGAKQIGLKRRECDEIIGSLKKRRLPYLDRWRAIRDYELPYTGELEDNPDETEQARRHDDHIYHGAAWAANQVFAAGIMSGLTPQSRQWFRLSFANRDLQDVPGAGELLDQRLDILNDVLNKSNFYNAIHSSYLELAYGQAPLGVFASAETGVHFIPFTVGTYFLDVDADGQINTFAREYWMTLRQLADKFGVENLPRTLQVAFENESAHSERHKVFWLVMPNRAREKGRIDKFHLPYVSVYWCEGSQANEWLDVGGFHEFPVPTGRFLVTGGAAYGKGPGWFAEGDAKGLQLLEQDYLTAVELGVKPPVQSDPQTAMKGINLIPGGNTITQTGNPVTPLFQVSVALDHLQAKITELTDRIKRAYAADLFLMLDSMDQTMTAREVMERTQEKMQQLGPVVQRMQFEFLSKIIERVYAILDRANVFPEPEDQELAQVLAQEEITIEYISPLAQAQKLSGLVNIEQAVSFAAQIAQFDPSAMDKLDLPSAVDKYCDMLGAPAAIRRPEDEYEEMQKQKAEAAAQQQQAAQAAAAVQLAVPATVAAKNMTEAANDGNPALAQMLGMDRLGLGGRL
jgi:hypothetical protein